MSDLANNNNLDDSINYDEIEQIIANDSNSQQINNEYKAPIDSTHSTNEKKLTLETNTRSSSNIAQIQNISLSLEKSLMNVEEQFQNDNLNKSKSSSILSVKTSNIPGPVGLLPILKTNDDLRRLKEDKTARDAFLTDDDNINAKRSKPSYDLFSLNINNYPSYTMALQQLHESFGCEPISIQTAIVKARLGIKKRIPLMCVAVTHYDRLENTILLDKSAHIRATFIGDEDLLDSYNIRIGHTLILRNVAVFTSTRRKHHYVNIYLQNIIAIQDPLEESFHMPLSYQEYEKQETSKSMLNSIENDISAYEDSSKSHNETFHIFSQSDNED